MKRRYVLSVVILATICLASQNVGATEIELPVDAETLEQTRQLFDQLPAVEFEGVRYLNPGTSEDDIAAVLAELVARLPASGEALIAIVANRGDPDRPLAIQVLAHIIEKLSSTQIEKLIHVRATAIAEGESHYPKGIASYVHTGYQ